MQEMDVDTAQGSTQRPAPEGTPDREAQARTKTQASDLMPRTLPTEVEEFFLEMSAATIATLRAVMREEISNGMSALEGRLTNKMDEQFIPNETRFGTGEVCKNYVGRKGGATRIQTGNQGEYKRCDRSS